MRRRWKSGHSSCVVPKITVLRLLPTPVSELACHTFSTVFHHIPEPYGQFSNHMSIPPIDMSAIPAPGSEKGAFNGIAIHDFQVADLVENVPEACDAAPEQDLFFLSTFTAHATIISLARGEVVLLSPSFCRAIDR